MLHVKRVTRKECEEYILDIHYAHRWPSISYAYGLYDNDELVGIISFGTPPSSPLRIGIAGTEFADKVIELNRLVLKYNRKNEASFLIGNALKLLYKDRGDSIVISFADTEQGHVGTVYKATNFKYYGLSAKRTDWKIKGKEHLHGQTVADEFRGKPNRSQLMRDKYGDDFYLKDRPRKHRYIYILGPKAFKKRVNIKYREVTWN